MGCLKYKKIGPNFRTFESEKRSVTRMFSPSETTRFRRSKKYFGRS